MMVSAKLRIISINVNYCNNQNWWVLLVLLNKKSCDINGASCVLRAACLNILGSSSDAQVASDK